jgi:AcrR family transcriptional regulator
MGDPIPERRPYDSPVRRERMEQTRERIVAAGARILHGFPVWNWGAVTHRSVAERAGVSERTVYRYFASERELRDAVMERLADEARVQLDGLQLENLRDAASRIIDYTASFPFEPTTRFDEPTLIAIHDRQRRALLAALSPFTDEWSDDSREIAAGMLDVLWNYATYEILVGQWSFDPKKAAAGVTWVIGLIEAAIRNGHAPEL